MSGSNAPRTVTIDFKATGNTAVAQTARSVATVVKSPRAVLSGLGINRHGQ